MSTAMAGDKLNMAVPLSMLPTQVRSYPSLNAAFNKTSVSVGRVWHLARAYDVKGQGAVELPELRMLLTHTHSPWRLFSPRRLRTVLDQGEKLGVWHRAKGRLYIHAPDRAAIALDAGLLRGRAVMLPISMLTGGVADARAAFYASFESGRVDRAPISRQALRNITGASESSQREYDKRLGRTTQKNYLVSEERYDPGKRQEAAWQGDAVFCFTDRNNVRGGGKGARYMARRLPDTRERCFAWAAKGRTRKYNQKIRDYLVNKRAQGSVEGQLVRTYHPLRTAAARAFGRNPNRPIIYLQASGLQPTAYTRTRLQRVNIWGELAQ